MPIYEYKCSDCSEEMEFIQKFSDDPIEECPKCKGRLEKLISANSFVLKGSGWYKTDYVSGSQKSEQSDSKDKKSDDKKSAGKEKKTEAVSA
ncbi:MAG: FmdB family transcriptional regulator [Nitrospirota bacterium]|nr:MAG: FmdB family transcriptional regulator [Nitrospirota bacterium]